MNDHRPGLGARHVAIVLVALAALVGGFCLLHPLRARVWLAQVWGLVVKYNIDFQTCQKCQSTRSFASTRFFGVPVRGTSTVQYKSTGFATCTHHWKSGISSAFPDPVPDGVVVLLRKNGKYGAFIPRNQGTAPERMQYDWWYRGDGKAVFDVQHPSVSAGQGAGRSIKFGPFAVSWSGHSRGSGWLYYGKYAGYAALPEDAHMCVTDQHSVDGIDAADARWTYRASPAP